MDIDIAPKPVPQRNPRMNRKIKGYGWVPDLPDQRDLRYAAPRRILAALPKSCNLRPRCPPVLDQGELGSCTANAIASAHRFDQMRQAVAGHFLPSRLFIYYNERSLEGTVKEDAGAQIRDGIKTLAKQGACPESLWPYDIAKFAKRPPRAAYREAEKHQAILYQRLTPTLRQLKGCLAEGYPFVFGFSVYESFESAAVARTGKAPLPGKDERSIGGHAVLATGYDDRRQRFVIMNSWGAGWGDKGYFTLPYAYLTSDGLADDFWTVRRVET
jgi:C1A family cysteine protease